ncbi:MAG: ferrous iron transport protein B [Bacillota bacterium]|nr:ferrous iron transport protein B [Bacillota bacterium]
MSKSNAAASNAGHGLRDRRRHPDDKVIALAGNPNVGKSTLFNGLTGLNQHTGNWPGKTVSNAEGYCRGNDYNYVLVDIPGAYSLMAHSAEEEVARDFICFGQPDAVIVVCDATCMERNLNLLLQIIEVTPRVLVCVNLLDEAKKKRISLDLPLLQQRLGVPVVGTTARQKSSLRRLQQAMEQLTAGEAPSALPSAAAAPAQSGDKSGGVYQVRYDAAIEAAVARLQPLLRHKYGGRLNERWLALRLIEQDAALTTAIDAHLGGALLRDEQLLNALARERELLALLGIDGDRYKDLLVSALVHSAEDICRGVVGCAERRYDERDRRLDRLLTGRRSGYPLMLALLALIFWLTISGANYPSALLADGLFWLQDRLSELFIRLGAPDWLHGALVLGVYRVLAWVVSVMLPPMAIFFPLFTLLEDAGYLPRIAYNLDKPFQRCNACGKQALTMCMGFGCNAAGVIGCRIIDSPRERMLAILTNSFVPCNGRFPTLIALLTMFFIGTVGGPLSSLLAALLLTALIVLGVAMTLIMTRLLSQTLLKGLPSSYTLELPPYRRPQIGSVIVRSLLDRTLFVLGRAVCVAAPAGLVIWLLANVNAGELSLLQHTADFLDPAARLLGMDGVILLAFILGFPANEIVVPIIIMTYLAQGSLLELGSLEQMRELFVAHGWTWSTAVSVMLFSLMHWPCSTTLLTIKKESGSLRWTALAALMPTACGVLLCLAFTAIVRLCGG